MTHPSKISLLGAALTLATLHTAASAQNTFCVENVFGNRSIWLSADGMDQRWKALDGAQFIERANGTATYLGAIVNLGDPNKRLSVRMDYGGRVDPGDPNYPPMGSPKINPFIQQNLVANGGIIDTNTWHYYTTMTGTMTGRLDYDGAMLSVARRGPAFQVGVGANEKDLSFGGSGWFTVMVMSPPATGVALPTSFDRGDTNTSFGNNCTCFAGVTASDTLYGAGVAGCAGVPPIGIAQPPLTGTSPQIALGNPDNVTKQCAMVWGLNRASRNVPFLGGNLLVSSPFAAVVTIPVPPGGTTFNCTIPDLGCQAGTQLNLQMVCIDTCAAAGFSLSRGLELMIGDM